MTGNPFADGPRPSRTRNAAASLGRLAARTISITIASLCVAWVAFPQTREPIGDVVKAFVEHEAYLTHEIYVAVHHRFWPEDCADDRDCDTGELCSQDGDCVLSAYTAYGRTDEWTQREMTHPLSLVPFCHDPRLISVRLNGTELYAAPNDCVVLIPVMEYRSVPVHVIRIDRAIGD